MCIFVRLVGVCACMSAGTLESGRGVLSLAAGVMVGWELPDVGNLSPLEEQLCY